MPQALMYGLIKSFVDQTVWFTLPPAQHRIKDLFCFSLLTFGSVPYLGHNVETNVFASDAEICVRLFSTIDDLASYRWSKPVVIINPPRWKGSTEPRATLRTRNHCLPSFHI